MLIAIPAIAGAVIGVASWSITNGGGDGTGSYFRATRTLIFHPPADSSSWAYQNLDEVALLATGGDVTAHVGADRGEDASDVANRIVTRLDPTTRSLQITVVGRRADDTKELADALGDELDARVTDTEQARFVAERDDTIARLQNLADELTQLDAQIATASGADRDVLTAQRRAIFNQYSFTYERFQQFTAEGTPADRLSTFERAQPVRISSGDYDALVDLIASGENHLRVDPNAAPADLPTSSMGWSDSALSRGLLGAFVGLFIGLGLAFATDRVKPRLRTRENVEDAFRAPVLTEIPRLAPNEQRSGEVVASAQPRSRAAEAYRAARSRILLHAGLGPAKPNGASGVASGSNRDARERGLVVMVASASPEEGKTTTTANLAVVLAETGASVLAVNGDLHRRRLDELLRAPRDPDGIVDTGIDGIRYADPVADASTLSPPNAVALQRQLVDEARQRFDFVLVDTAPLLTTNDATELLPAVDVVVLVARAGVTTLGAAERARDLLDHLGASVSGVVLLDPYLTANDPYYGPSSSTANAVADATSSQPPRSADDLRIARLSR